MVHKLFFMWELNLRSKLNPWDKTLQALNIYKNFLKIEPLFAWFNCLGHKRGKYLIQYYCESRNKDLWTRFEYDLFRALVLKLNLVATHHLRTPGLEHNTGEHSLYFKTAANFWINSIGLGTKLCKKFSFSKIWSNDNSTYYLIIFWNHNKFRQQ